VARPKAGEHGIATAERILRAAEEEFAARGFALVGLAKIAARAEVTRPSLLYHYPSKDALYRAALGRSLGRLSGILESASSAGGGFEECLERLVRGFTQFVEDDAPAARLFLRAAIDTGGPGRRLVRELVAPIVDGVVALIEAHSGALPRGLPVRAAVMQVVASELLRSASGPLGPLLFGAGPGAWEVARFTFLGRSIDGRRSP
jgi:AcrR family transcriptional regulator